jgi:1,4-alpha-glucan branching enzyme
VQGRHRDPHRVLGAHPVQIGQRPGVAVRAFIPGDRRKVFAVTEDASGRRQRVQMPRVHDQGLFEVVLPPSRKPVRHFFELQSDDGSCARVDDPYRFGSTVSDFDKWLFNEGTLQDVAGAMGAHPARPIGRTSPLQSRDRAPGTSFYP